MRGLEYQQILPMDEANSDSLVTMSSLRASSKLRDHKEQTHSDHVWYVEEDRLRECFNASCEALMSRLENLEAVEDWDIPWSPSPESSNTRHALYEKLLDIASADDLHINVRLQKSPQDKHNPYLDDIFSTTTFVEPSLLRGRFIFQSKNPLNVIRVQNPHLSDEINALYYSRCQFVVGDESNAEMGLSLGLQWLISIPTSLRAYIKDIRIITSYHRLTENTSFFPHLLKALALSPPARDLTNIDFHVSPVQNAKKVVDQEEIQECVDLVNMHIWTDSSAILLKTSNPENPPLGSSIVQKTVSIFLQSFLESSE
ncbi:MAG: hypothetical protein Q9160_003001 [Pyrenula sp. 1 TL-2023]